MKQKKRLTVDDRINLQACIAKNLSWKETSKILKKNRSTIYRELKKYFTIHDGRHSCVHCVKYDCCKELGIAVHQGMNYECFEPAYCSKLSHFPFCVIVVKTKINVIEKNVTMTASMLKIDP